MKKCPRCVVFYQLDDRTHCIFCNGTLQTLTLYELSKISSFQSKREKETRAQAEASSFVDHQKMSPFLAHYYQTLSFAESYRFCRYQMKKGKTLPRFFVQPLSIMFFIKIPWFFINCVDSVLFRFFYKGYCEQCGCKYILIASKSLHAVDKCKYLIDFQDVLNRIFLGEIFILEEDLVENSRKQLNCGRRNAYQDLIAHRQGKRNTEDILMVLLSALMIFFVFTSIIMPLIRKFYYFMYL